MSKTIYIASRYRADTDEQFEKQLQLTKDFSREVVIAGFDVIVPHLYYPLFLDDNCEEERTIGTESAIRLMDVCDAIFVYIGLGVSSGMEAEIDHAKKNDMSVKYFRNLNELKDLLKKQTSQDADDQEALSEALLKLHKQMYKVGDKMLKLKWVEVDEKATELLGASKVVKGWSEDILNLDEGQ